MKMKDEDEDVMMDDPIQMPPFPPSNSNIQGKYSKKSRKLFTGNAGGSIDGGAGGVWSELRVLEM